jgi:hypothetical protein
MVTTPFTVVAVKGVPKENNGGSTTAERTPSFDNVNCDKLFLVTVTPVPPVKLISFVPPLESCNLREVVPFGTV